MTGLSRRQTLAGLTLAGMTLPLPMQALASAARTDAKGESMSLEIETVAEGLGFPEGPIWMKDGSILFVEIYHQRLSRLSPDGKVSVVADLGGGPNGAAIGPDGAAYICNNGGFEWHDVQGLLIPGHAPKDYATGSIQRVDLATGKITVLYDQCEGERLHGPNDIVFDGQGGFWFTDYGKSFPDRKTHSAIYYAKVDGSQITKVRGELISANGIGLSPAGDCVYFADTMTGRVFAIDLDEPGKAKAPPAPWLPGRLLATLPGFQLLDSLKVEADGNVCVGTLIEGGVTVFTPAGHHTHVPFPDLSITNVVFGGADMRDMWATGSSTGKMYRTRWARPGLKLAYYA